MDEVLEPVLDHLGREDPGEVIGVYLFGSAVTSELGPHSDVDVLVLTGHSLTTRDRTGLVELLLEVSGWSGHAARFPGAAHRRPVELTSLVAGDVQPWTDHPRRDFQYGEWLREDLVGGAAVLPTTDPDVIPLAATALTANRTLRGPALDDVLAPVPPDLLHRALLAAIPTLLAEIQGDERNTLLTLARILVTLQTGRMV